jgi:hypothetical protein
MAGCSPGAAKTRRGYGVGTENLRYSVSERLVKIEVKTLKRRGILAINSNHRT